MLRNNLAKLMIDRGVSATQLFNDTGIARSTISKISNNNTDKISLQTIDKLCNYLRISPADFFDYLPYEVRINCGFENFESLDLVKKHFKSTSNFEEGAWLSISFYEGRDLKYNFDISFVYGGEYEPGYPFDDGFIFFITEMKYNENNPSSNFFDEIPVQFKNNILEDTKQLLANYFEVDKRITAISKFDPVALEILS